MHTCPSAMISRMWYWCLETSTILVAVSMIGTRDVGPKPEPTGRSVSVMGGQTEWLKDALYQKAEREERSLCIAAVLLKHQCTPGHLCGSWRRFDHASLLKQTWKQNENTISLLSGLLYAKERRIRGLTVPKAEAWDLVVFIVCWQRPPNNADRLLVRVWSVPEVMQASPVETMLPLNYTTDTSVSCHAQWLGKGREKNKVIYGKKEKKITDSVNLSIRCSWWNPPRLQG